MAALNLCNICDRKVLGHSYKMTCDLCNRLVHLKCLPKVDKTQSIYTLRESSVWYCTKCSEEMLPYNHIYDDDEFLIALSDNWDLPDVIPYDLVQNNNKIFLPFDLNENLDIYNHMAEIDPDINYYSNQCNTLFNSCDYYLENSFNKKIQEFAIDANSFSLMHCNIRSAVKNLSKLETYLSNLDHNFSIIALSESWLKDHNFQLYLES